MRWVIALLMQFGQGLNALHFNIRLALFGAAVCCLHTCAALLLLSRARIPASTAEQVINFSMSGTLFLLVGATVSGLAAARKGERHARIPVPDPGKDQDMPHRGPRAAAARHDPCADVACEQPEPPGANAG
jgi:hypothetical protein